MTQEAPRQRTRPEYQVEPGSQEAGHCGPLDESSDLATRVLGVIGHVGWMQDYSGNRLGCCNSGRRMMLAGEGGEMAGTGWI